jgi:hypothetical protein
MKLSDMLLEKETTRDQSTTGAISQLNTYLHKTYNIQKIDTSKIAPGCEDEIYKNLKQQFRNLQARDAATN